MEQEIIQTLSSTPNWDSMTAYERTKLVCVELTHRGLQIPNWTTLRDLIGKGSAGDINRAKKDFRLEHASMLRGIGDFSDHGVPQNLGPLFIKLWQEAVALAKSSFSEQEKSWEATLQKAQQSAQESRTALDDAQTTIKDLQRKIENLATLNQAQEKSIESSRAALSQAEKNHTQTRNDYHAHIEKVEKTLRESQESLETAIDRMESTEKLSKIEIERARQAAIQQVSSIKEKMAQERSSLDLDIARLTRTNNELAQEKQLLTEQLKSTEAQLLQLQESLKRQTKPTRRASRKRALTRRTLNSTHKK